MNDHRPGPAWTMRYLRVGAALVLGLGLLLWVAPVNVSGRNLVPFGCGSPSSPASGQLAAYVCRTQLNNTKAIVVALLVAGGILLILSEFALVRWGENVTLRGVALAAPIAVLALAVSIAALFTVVGSAGADGTLIRCGTAVAPARDTISTGLCGDLTLRRQAMAMGGVMFGLGLLLAGPYLYGGRVEDPDTPPSPQGPS